MKKRLKGLVSIWLVLVMLASIWPMSVTAYAQTIEPVEVMVYSGNPSVAADELVSYDKIAVIPDVALNEQSDVTSVLYGDLKLTGWDVWDTDWSGYHSGYVFVEKVSGGNAANWAPTASDLEQYADDYSALVPVYGGNVAIYTDTDEVAADEFVGDYKVVSAKTDKALSEQAEVMKVLDSSKSLEGWDVWSAGWSGYYSGTVWIEKVSEKSADYTPSAMDLENLGSGDYYLVPVYGAAPPHKHPICGAAHTDIGDHISDCKEVEWQPLSSLLGEPGEDGMYPGATINTNGNYYLDKDIEIKYNQSLTIFSDVSLCLNGHTITITNSYGAFYVGSGATLNICDCSTNQSGKIENTNASPDYAGIFNTGGTVNVYSGTVSSSNNSNGIFNNGGTVNVYGGTVESTGTDGNDYGIYNNKGSLKLSGVPTITGNTAGIYLAADQTITITDALTNTTPYSVYTAATPTAGSPVAITNGTETTDYSGKFTTVNTDYKIDVVQGGGTYQVVLALKPTDFTATVNLTKDGEAWADSGKTVALYQNGESKYALTGSNGTFTAANVPNGTYDVYVDGEDTNVDVSNTAATADVEYFTVSYSMGDKGATGTLPESAIVLKGSTYIVSTSTPLQLDGYSQSGWNTTELFNGNRKDSLTVDGRTTLKPSWRVSLVVNKSATYNNSSVDAANGSVVYVEGASYVMTALHETFTGANYTYVWKDGNDNKITGATDASYSVQNLIAGTHQYKVTVKCEGPYSGSAEQTQTFKITIAQPTLTGNLSISLPEDDDTPNFGDTLTANYDGTETVSYQWVRVDGNTETSLTADTGSNGTKYTLTAADIGKTIKVKVTGTGNYGGTVTSEATAEVAKAPAATTPDSSYTIDYAAETITFTNPYEVSTKKDGTGSDIASGSSVSALLGETIYIRTKATLTHDPSDWVAISIAARPAAPTGIVVTNETAAGQGNGSVTGITAEMEYKIGTGAWASGTGADLTGLAAGTQITVRVKATAAAPHGEEQTYTVSAGNTLTVTFDAQSGSAVAAVTGLSYNATITELPETTRTGYTFGGWNTVSDGTGTSYSAEANVAVTANITLYAQWTANTYTVKFHANGGTDEMTDQSFTYDEAQQLTSNAFIRSGYSFAGWAATENGVAVYVNSQNVRNLTAEDDAVINLYAVWSAMPVYGISGTVFESDTTTPISGAAVQLKQGSTVLAEVTTDASGNYSIPGVSAGLYNVVAGKDGVTMTIMVEVTDNLTGQNITMPARNTNSVLKVTNDEGAAEFKVVVDGLDQEAAHWGDENQSAASVTITMTVTAEAADQNDTEQEEIRDKAPGATVEFLDITVTKTVDSDTSSLNETNQVLEIVVPYDFSGKINVNVYRKHGAEPAAALIKLSTEPTAPYTDGSFWLDTVNGKIHIYTNKFSTYAIGYTVPTSSSGGYTPTYAITVERSENGEVKANRSYASSGSTVTITVDPETGYVLNKLTVTDERGNNIEVTDKGDGTFTFKMPGRKVTVETSFAAVGSYSTCPGDHTCPIWPYTDAETTAWYHDGVHYCIENGLMSGYGDGIFKPNADTTRAMITVMLWRLNGSPVVNDLLDFEDVEEGQWYTEAIRWAKSEGIAEGYGNGYFGMNDAITREQMVTILWRYAQYKGIDVSVGENTNILSYDDALDVAEYAIPAMQWACGSGMVRGKNDPNGGMILDPESNGTRAQIATMMMRFCENIMK